MWKKAFIRVALVIIVVIGGMLVFAASNTAQPAENIECTDNSEKCIDNKGRGEFIIWESLSRTIMANVQH